MDTIRYSVWTTRPNTTETYVVCHVKGDDAFFTLDEPSVIDYMLVSNSTWGYLAMTYGDTYGTKEEPQANPNIPSAPKGFGIPMYQEGLRNSIAVITSSSQPKDSTMGKQQEV